MPRRKLIALVRFEERYDLSQSSHYDWLDTGAEEWEIREIKAMYSVTISSHLEIAPGPTSTLSHPCCVNPSSNTERMESHMVYFDWINLECARRTRIEHSMDNEMENWIDVRSCMYTEPHV